MTALKNYRVIQVAKTNTEPYVPMPDKVFTFEVQAEDEADAIQIAGDIAIENDDESDQGWNYETMLWDDATAKVIPLEDKQ
jgi:hypothetical protein